MKRLFLILLVIAFFNSSAISKKVQKCYFLDEVPEKQKPNDHVEKSETPNEDDDNSLIVMTDKGKVRGLIETSLTGKKVDAWFGIPYAQPPLGSLRFKRPHEPSMWQGIKNATKHPNTCFQTLDVMFPNFSGSEMWNANTELSEDCLYLNVVVPRPRPKNATVMVWIYGGGFYSGTSTLDVYDLRTLAAEENVIMVSMQYRVASLGFLYSGTDDAPGSVGLLDQNLALKWINRNIHKFGGDRNKVCLFGESAGAVSVSMHLLSPLSKSLFNRAIMQSSSVSVPWAYDSHDKAISRTLKLAKNVECPYDNANISQSIECLREKDANVLVNSEWLDLTDLKIIEFPFVPVVDGEFLIEDPSISVQSGHFKKADLLTGSNENEGFYFLLYFLSSLLPKVENVTVPREGFLEAVKSLFPDLSDSVHQAIISKYDDGDLSDGLKNLNALDKMTGDFKFACGVNEFAQRYAEEGNDVFMYYFTQRSEINPWPKWTGVMHGDEIEFVFGGPLNPDLNFSDKQKEFTRRVMHYWANFARTGNPNSDLIELPTWERYRAESKNYFEINMNSANNGKCLRCDQCGFWNEQLENN